MSRYSVVSTVCSPATELLTAGQAVARLRPKPSAGVPPRMLGRRARIRLGVHVLQVDDLVLRDRPLVEVRVLNRVITAGTRHKRPALNYIGTSTRLEPHVHQRASVSAN